MRNLVFGLMLLMISGCTLHSADAWHSQVPEALSFIARSTNYDVTVRRPRIEVASPCQIVMVYRGLGPECVLEAGEHENDIQFYLLQGVYFRNTETIFLRNDFIPGLDNALLVHEYMHHLQHVHDVQFSCPTGREYEARRVHQRYVHETGRGTPFTLEALNEVRCPGRE